MPDTSGSWRTAPLVAIDLEGSGPQDPDGEAILEIALVPLHHGHPAVEHAFSSLINPGRRIRRGPWISPGITNDLLSQAPAPNEVRNTIKEQVAGRILVGHNVSVDSRLLHRHIPDAEPAGLLDTLRLARALHPEQKKGHALGAWIDRLGLTDAINRAAPHSQPHRALWDAIAAALLLAALLDQADPGKRTLAALLKIAGLPVGEQPPQPPSTDQPLW